MPLKRRDRNADLVARELRRLADLLEDLKGAEPAGGGEASAHLELKQIAVRLQRISTTLEAGKNAGRTTAAQLRSMARNFEGIAEALEKGAATSPSR
jgi:hypothetical protein